MPIKAVLDKSASYLENIEIEIHSGFLSSNITNLLQPMDQGIIDSFKGRYRYKLLWEIPSKL